MKGDRMVTMSVGIKKILTIVYWGMRGRHKNRGMPICKEWINSQHAFIEWSFENGWAKGLYLDRRDGTKGYSPDNCRYVTPLVNSRNRIKVITDFTKGTRRCRVCKQEKSMCEFYKSKGHSLGYTYLCKPCKRNENRLSYHKNK